LLFGLSGAAGLAALLAGGLLYSQKGPLLTLPGLRPTEAVDANETQFAAAFGSRAGDRHDTPGSDPIRSAQENARRPERAGALIKPEDNRPAVPDRGGRRDAPSGYYFVAGASFVRAQPAASAEIIATLKPGTRISIAGRTGEYYRVRSLGAENIRGYVHREDAFFEGLSRSRAPH
jgi:hypothetical protein